MLVNLLISLAHAGSACWAADDFLKNMRKAQSVREDPYKLEYYSRAIRAWGPADGYGLLAECHFRRGQAHSRRNESEAALADISKTIALDARNGQALLLRGQLLIKTGRRKDALRDYRNACELGQDEACRRLK